METREPLPAAARTFICLGSAAALLAVLLGAFGAHAIKGRLGADMLAIWHTAVEYHFYHSLGLLAVGLLAIRLPRSVLLKWSGWTMAGGIVLFSGSLYLLAWLGISWLGAVTPLGGGLFVVAWSLLAAVAVRAA